MAIFTIFVVSVRCCVVYDDRYSRFFCPEGGGVHDLRMDGGYRPVFRKLPPLIIVKVAIIPTFMMNFGGILIIFD